MNRCRDGRNCPMPCRCTKGCDARTGGCLRDGKCQAGKIVNWIDDYVGSCQFGESYFRCFRQISTMTACWAPSFNLHKSIIDQNVGMYFVIQNKNLQMAHKQGKWHTNRQDGTRTGKMAQEQGRWHTNREDGTRTRQLFTCREPLTVVIYV